MTKQKKSILLGSLLGYYGIRAINKRKEPPKVFIGKKKRRIHHYWMALGALLPIDTTFKGIFLGAGLEDLPDLREDVSKRLPRRKKKYRGRHNILLPQDTSL
jgi:hypothetical protein